MRRVRSCRHRLGLALLLAWSLAAGGPARANSLAADLSEHLIAITTAFVGTDVVLFGATDGEGDIVVTVQGPRQEQVVRRKARVGGIWINRDLLSFANTPGYYAVAASGPLEEIARPDVQARLELGVEHLDLRPLDADELDAEQIGAFRSALVRRKQLQGLYSETPEPVSFIGPSLFRTRLHFPANVSPGIYRVQVFHLNDGFVEDAQRSSLIISKVGLEADVFDFAQEQAALYGLGAIVMALLAGWLAGLIFRRG
jgi:uncharacterized protein (TIGR02186 family)